MECVEQAVLTAKQHSCFHCDCAENMRTLQEAVDSATRHTWPWRKETAMRAMSTGVYGEHAEWRKEIQHAAPIMKVVHVHGAEHVTAASMDRYDHCSSVTGVIPEHNALWNATELDLNQMCRDDELHQMRLGMMPHILAAVMSKICLDLHPDWALQLEICPGVSGMRSVWQRLSGRMLQCETTMTPYVAHGFMRAFVSRQVGHAFKFVLTGHECEAVFMLVSICLPGLVDTELSVLNAARSTDEHGRARRVPDPIPEIIDIVCRVLAWYMCMKMQAHTLSQVLTTPPPTPKTRPACLLSGATVVLTSRMRACSLLVRSICCTTRRVTYCKRWRLHFRAVLQQCPRPRSPPTPSRAQVIVRATHTLACTYFQMYWHVMHKICIVYTQVACQGCIFQMCWHVMKKQFISLACHRILHMFHWHAMECGIYFIGTPTNVVYIALACQGCTFHRYALTYTQWGHTHTCTHVPGLGVCTNIPVCHAPRLKTEARG
jgi:hypothetical protein